MFKDPSHLKNGDLVALYEHWRKRCSQYGIDQMFRFSHTRSSAGLLKAAEYKRGLMQGVGDELHIGRSSRSAADAMDNDADMPSGDESFSEPEIPLRKPRKGKRKASTPIESQSDDDDHRNYFLYKSSCFLIVS